MHCNSPRANAGFMIFAASIEPSEPPPAPTSVWISSRNNITFPLDLVSSRILFSRSSNCPRYCVPATIRAISIATTRLLSILSGTLPATIACAMPSAIAVLPTPASPSSTTLFFVRRERICIVRSSSLVLPITGSRSLARANAVKSRPNALSIGVFRVFALLAEAPPEVFPSLPDSSS